MKKDRDFKTKTTIFLILTLTFLNISGCSHKNLSGKPAKVWGVAGVSYESRWKRVEIIVKITQVEVQLQL